MKIKKTKIINKKIFELYLIKNKIYEQLVENNKIYKQLTLQKTISNFKKLLHIICKYDKQNKSILFINENNKQLDNNLENATNVDLIVIFNKKNKIKIFNKNFKTPIVSFLNNNVSTTFWDNLESIINLNKYTKYKKSNIFYNIVNLALKRNNSKK